MKMFLLCLFFFGLSTPAGAGTEVNNGAGLSEQNVVYAFSNLKALLENCLLTSACGLSVDEVSTVGNAAAPITSGEATLLFATEGELPGQEFSVARGRWIVNSDRLWKDAEHSIAFTIADAVDLLLRMGDAQLHRLSESTRKKLTTYFSSTVRQVNIELANDLSLHFLFWQERAHLVVRANSAESLDLTPLIQTALTPCSGPIRVLDPVYQGATAGPVDSRAYILLRAQNACEKNWVQLALTLVVGRQALEVQNITPISR